MGQAKRRGSFEERKAEAIIKNEANRIKRIKETIDRRRNMSDEEKIAEFEFIQKVRGFMQAARLTNDWNYRY